jgi:hypothetical protein
MRFTLRHACVRITSKDKLRDSYRAHIVCIQVCSRVGVSVPIGIEQPFRMKVSNEVIIELSTSA